MLNLQGKITFFRQKKKFLKSKKIKFHHVFEYCLFCLGLRTADFTLSICQVAYITVHRDILSLGLLRSLWWNPFMDSIPIVYETL
jgi:hypothetical protein